MHIVTRIAYALVVIGAINWGLVGLFSLDLVAALFGEMTPAARLIYILVGISGVLAAIAMFFPGAQSAHRHDRTHATDSTH